MAHGDQQLLKIVVMGLPNSGKSSFIQIISDEVHRQQQEFSSWFFGKLAVDQHLTIQFAEPPSQKVADFMWMRDLVSNIRAAGYILLVDSTRSQTFGKFVSILYTIRGYDMAMPVVVATNKQDHAGAWSHDDIRIGLRINDDIPVLPCVANNRAMVEEVVVQLLYQMMGQPGESA
jgi:signal recognition particle receptor subunit beta